MFPLKHVTLILASKIFSAFWMTGSVVNDSCVMLGGGGAGLPGIAAGGGVAAAATGVAGLAIL